MTTTRYIVWTKASGCIEVVAAIASVEAGGALCFYTRENSLMRAFAAGMWVDMEVASEHGKAEHDRFTAATQAAVSGV